MSYEEEDACMWAQTNHMRIQLKKVGAAHFTPTHLDEVLLFI
jgi:hypothetical protein